MRTRNLAAPHDRSSRPTGNRLTAIVGATASGKSDAAVLVATRFNGEVVNADSRLFYRGMEIGTASPSEEVLRSIRHHLVGFLEPSDRYSLAEFLGLAAKTIVDVQDRGALPVLAGGTGQYVWGLLEGWQVPSVPPDPQLREKLELELAERGVDALYLRLRELDPEAAAVTDGRNHRRVIRALERVIAGSEGEQRTAEDPGYDALVIGLYVERSELHRRIAARIDRMLATGWIEEVRTLIARGVDLASPALSAIGYREIAAHLAGEMSLEEARERTIHATNRLVRHQNNWFKQGDPRIQWVDVTDGDVEPVAERVREWLSD